MLWQLNIYGKDKVQVAIERLKTFEPPEGYYLAFNGSYNRLYQTHGIGTYSEYSDSWMINHETGWHKLRVIAWMPLPEFHQEVEECVTE